MLEGFNDNLYLIDLSYLNTPAEVVYDLSSILDTDLAKNQRVKLKLGNVDFNKTQLLSIKSLVESINSTLAIVDGKSEITRASAIAAGLVYQNSADMVPDTAFTDKIKNEIPENPVISEVKPELFPEVAPVKEEISEENTQESVDITSNVQQDDNENKEDNIEPEFKENEENQSESFEICPPKFESNDDNLDFEKEEKQEWVDKTEQNFEEGFANNNWNSSRMPNAEEKENTVVEETVLNQETQETEEKNVETEEKQELSKICGIENFEEPKEEIAEEKEETPGIQTLADIPLDIPTDKTIQEELSVIYNTERKLEDVFENTGLKEEKFKSIKETPKSEEREYTQYDFELEAFPTKYLKQTICAGQFISFEGNLVVIGDCHEGSEISAAGEITIWGELSGSAHAGKNGNEKCKIRALRLNASQLRIANCYVKRPTVLNTQNTVQIDSAPEEAMIQKGEIVVYKIYK